MQIECKVSRWIGKFFKSFQCTLKDLNQLNGKSCTKAQRLEKTEIKIVWGVNSTPVCCKFNLIFHTSTVSKLMLRMLIQVLHLNNQEGGCLAPNRPQFIPVYVWEKSTGKAAMKVNVNVRERHRVSLVVLFFPLTCLPSWQHRLATPETKMNETSWTQRRSLDPFLHTAHPSIYSVTSRRLGKIDEWKFHQKEA